MLFTPEDEKQIIEAIRLAETMSTGEIRVHLDQKLEGDPLAKAQDVFYKIGMDKTKDKNGILFYVSENKKQVAVIGDQNVHIHVKQSFWDQILNEILSDFKKNHFKEGLINAINKTGIKLKKHFPNNGEITQNELPDEISR